MTRMTKGMRTNIHFALDLALNRLASLAIPQAITSASTVSTHATMVITTAWIDISMHHSESVFFHTTNRMSTRGGQWKKGAIPMASRARGPAHWRNTVGRPGLDGVGRPSEETDSYIYSSTHT